MNKRLLIKAKKKLLLYILVLCIAGGVAKCGNELEEEKNVESDVELEEENTLMKILKIDEVRPYLEKGYELIIRTNYVTSNVLGTLILWESPYSIKDLREVKVDEFMTAFENLKNNLDYQYCSVQYDCEQDKIINSIKQNTYSGVYNENNASEVVGNLKVTADDIFTSFMYQDMMVKNFINSDVVDKVKIKKGDMII